MHRARTADKAAKLRLKEMANVRQLISLAGFTLLDIDRKYNLARGTAGTTLREPNINGERAISQALDKSAAQLWPSRYQKDGRRRTPQPADNYNRPPTLRERRRLHETQQDAA